MSVFEENELNLSGSEQNDSIYLNQSEENEFIYVQTVITCVMSMRRMN